MSTVLTGESATVTAHRLGLTFKKRSAGTLTNDQLLDLAVNAYWMNRNRRTAGRHGQ